MELGDRYLVVQRAAIGANAGKGAYNESSEAAMSSDLSKLAPGIISAATAGEAAVPTRVMQMLNMVTMEDLIDDQDFEDLVEDIKEECGKYGTVVDVKIPRPILNENGKVDQKASDAVEDLMKVFVMYEDTEQVKKAMLSIA
jgi:splicing factor U2AF subunit